MRDTENTHAQKDSKQSNICQSNILFRLYEGSNTILSSRIHPSFPGRKKEFQEDDSSVFWEWMDPDLISRMNEIANSVHQKGQLGRTRWVVAQYNKAVLEWTQSCGGIENMLPTSVDMEQAVRIFEYLLAQH